MLQRPFSYRNRDAPRADFIGLEPILRDMMEAERIIFLFGYGNRDYQHTLGYAAVDIPSSPYTGFIHIPDYEPGDVELHLVYGARSHATIPYRVRESRLARRICEALKTRGMSCSWNGNPLYPVVVPIIPQDIGQEQQEEDDEEATQTMDLEEVGSDE